MSRAGELRACYDAESSSYLDLRGTVILAWHIDPQGNVHDTRIVRSTLLTPSVADCVGQQIRFGVASSDAGAR